MSFSAAAAGNFQFFSSLGGGCQKVLRQSAAAAGKFQFFFLCRRRRLETFLFSAAAAENFPKFFEKISSFREIFA
jgi:hypothetical protein